LYRGHVPDDLLVAEFADLVVGRLQPPGEVAVLAARHRHARSRLTGPDLELDVESRRELTHRLGVVQSGVGVVVRVKHAVGAVSECAGVAEPGESVEVGEFGGLDEVLILAFGDEGLPVARVAVGLGPFGDIPEQRCMQDAAPVDKGDRARGGVDGFWPIAVAGTPCQVTAGEHISAALPGAGQPNSLCASEPEAAVDTTENARSVGALIIFGKFRFLDLGDLTKRKERDLVCPNNLIGTVDLYLTTHHGWNQSNARVIVDAIHPRVSVMNNGAHKGGSPDAWETIHNSPGLQDLWQLHYALESDKAHNVPEMFIANLNENCEGKYIKVAAEPNGTFTVWNSRNDFKKTYSK